MIRYFEGGWEIEHLRGGYRYLAPGNYDDSLSLPDSVFSHFISEREMRQLIPVLEASGLIVPRLDERLRTEDLKITHRLLDLLEKKQK